MRYLPLVLLTGCVMATTITASSLDHMAAAQSGATSARAPVEAAREVTRLFAVRGYALGDDHPMGNTGGYAIRLTKSNRNIAVTKTDDQRIGPLDVGSVFYVWVMPNAAGSTITMVGKPTLNGAEPCSAQTPGLACASDFETDPTFAATYLSGESEAEVAHGVLSELALEGFATGPLPAATPIIPGTHVAPPVDHAVCEQQRHAAFARAQATQDLDERTRLLQSAPACN
jgi:hypothetical protein